MFQLNKIGICGSISKLFVKYLLLFLLIFHINNCFSQVLETEKKEFSLNKKLNVSVTSLETPSLGSIGVSTKFNDDMNLDIWNNMSASEIVSHLNFIPDVVSSNSLQSHLIDLYLSSSNPPRGNSDEVINFLETRLIKIRRSGQSKKLYEIIKQLPQGERWELWRLWSTEYELLIHEDKRACKLTNKQIETSSDKFWQMSRIFCLLIDDKLNDAEFIFDLIKSRGFSNKNFENLFQLMNGDTSDFVLDNTIIEPIHIIMMETLKIPIKVNSVAALGPEYTDPLLTLTYLTPKARAFLLDKKMNYGNVPLDQIKENYKSVSDGSLSIEEAIASYSKKPNGFHRANVWMSIMTLKDDIKKVETIFKIINFEIKNGRFYHSINLYLPILQEINSASLTKKLNNLIAKLLIVKNPVLFPEDQLANTLLLKAGAEWEWQFILQQKAWTLIPVLEDAGMVQPKSFDWLKVLNKTKNQNTNEQKYNKWNKNYNLKSFLLTKGIEEASNNNEKALTLILLARLLGNDPLVDFEIGQLMTIRKSLFKLGFNELADNLTLEIMIPKLISF
tara:strand:- start:1233 stop:2912 length:1680 start_codon:yes stop_codon:yes gene_type:complete